jgi:LAS superfamily LD-carboxypeptidase LdcB
MRSIVLLAGLCCALLVGAAVLYERAAEARSTSGLDPALHDALRSARTAARTDGVDIEVTSGRRSPEEQERLLRDAVVRYGSAEEAARWVATVETSPHVSGDAIDVGPAAAMSWLARHGAEHGLCQIYGNEPWHFELRPDAVGRGCPLPFADPTEDPRMQGG